MLKKIIELKNKVKTNAVVLKDDNNGAELVAIVIGVLIAVVIGGILLKFADTSLIEIGTLTVNKVKTLFSL